MLALLLSVTAGVHSAFSQEAMFFNQPCDHFNAESSCTFRQKYEFQTLGPAPNSCTHTLAAGHCTPRYFINTTAFEPSADDAIIAFIPGGEAAMGGFYGYQIMKGGHLHCSPGD
jgi:hypothetical protein